MIIKIGDREVEIKSVNGKITNLSIRSLDPSGRTEKISVVNMDKAETAALIAGLQAEKPKG